MTPSTDLTTAALIGFALLSLALQFAAVRARRARRTAESRLSAMETDLASSERHRLALSEAERQRAVAASEAKSRFVATVSHEMRTPLSGVLGMADLLASSPLTAEQATYVKAIRHSGEALLSLIEEVLDFSRIEAGKLSLEPAPVALRPLVESVVELLAPKAQGRGLEIAALVEPDVPETVEADAQRLRQVLVNLAGNAVKFTESGGVGIRVAMAGARLLLTVEDTGIGIAPERLASIFEEFEQADSSAMNAHGGTGLGLAISQRIVAQMGGSIGVESVPGLGSTFRVTLPCTPLSPASNDKVPDLAGQTIRIISRQPFEARFLEERLGRCGALVQRVSGGEDGPLPRADVLLLDAALGRETARVLAEAARAAGTPERLVMLSPYERRDFGALQELGFTGYLVKPIRERSLHARLGPALPHRSVERELPSPAAAVLAGQRILLAEDNPINALIARKHLESLGAEVVWASDGLEAARLAEAAIDGEARRFEAMLCDFRMPGLDGLSLARRLRAHEALRRAPPVRMLAVTANAFAEDREAAMAAGYDAFVPKPVDRERLAEALGVTLGVAA